MILRTILFFILLYILIKVLSRLFLPSTGRKRSGSYFFYTNRPHQRSRNRNKGNVEQKLDQIEEAEYEDVTEEEVKNSKSE